MVERFNRTLENQLAVFVEKHQQDWDDHVPLILLAYRSAVHESTGQTPSCLMFGRDVNLPVDLLMVVLLMNKNLKLSRTMWTS